MIKTTGREEGNAAYCRGKAIVLPASKLQLPPNRLQRLLMHELFHLLSRQDPQLRKQLYGIVGFTPCDPIALPASMCPPGRLMTALPIASSSTSR